MVFVGDRGLVGNHRSIGPQIRRVGGHRVRVWQRMRFGGNGVEQRVQRFHVLVGGLEVRIELRFTIEGFDARGELALIGSDAFVCIHVGLKGPVVAERLPTLGPTARIGFDVFVAVLTQLLFGDKAFRATIKVTPELTNA